MGPRLGSPPLQSLVALLLEREMNFNSIKNSLFRGRFSQSQVDGINRLLEAMGDMEDFYKAYLLATCYHETARTMQPITEYGGRSYFNKYEGRSSLGNNHTGDGYKYRGRGDVMITGRRNYTLFSKLLGIDLVNKPKLALDPKISARILIKGCTEGLFTGHKMSDFDNYRDMRKVVNGTDRAALIATYAEEFLTALPNRGVTFQDSIPVTTGKPPHKSTTNIAAATAGLSMAASASSDVQRVVANLGIDPKWLFLAVGVAALVWVVKERISKMRNEGV